MLSTGVLEVGGIPLVTWPRTGLGGRGMVTVIKKTVMLSMVEIPRVIFSPDSAGIRKTKLEDGEHHLAS